MSDMLAGLTERQLLLKILADTSQILQWIKASATPRITGEKIVFIVQDSQVPVNFQISVASATDSMGQPADPSTLKHVVTSSDPTIATVGPNSAAPDDGTRGTLTFLGLEGPFTLNDQIEDSAGNVIGALAANFTVTAGLPTAIFGGSIAFDGLTEAHDGP